MAAKGKTQMSKATEWDRFARKHSGNTFLNLDPLYALPRRLIDLLVGKDDATISQEVQRVSFFSDAELEFEYDLAAAATGGFFNQLPFECLLLPELQGNKAAPVASEIQTLLGEELQHEGQLAGSVTLRFRDDANQQSLVTQRAAAYAGWLISNASFRRERDKLQKRSSAYVAKRRTFPSLPLTLLGQPSPGRSDADWEMESAFTEFYRRWELVTFLTWDLPVPMQMLTTDSVGYDITSLSDSGVNLFVPWYLLRGGKVSLNEISRRLQQLHNPQHLSEWLRIDASDGDAHGEKRFRNSLVVYRYHHLAIKSRYGKRSVEKHDQALALLLSVKLDSIKKLRLNLNRLLGVNP
jgi:hypothetical protein